MKLKKFVRVIDDFEDVKVWGKDENIPLYEGMIREIPEEILELKIPKVPSGFRDAPVEFRRDAIDCGPHYSIEVIEPD